MQTEIEAKFLNTDHDAIRRKLRQLGAQRVQPQRLTKRRNYDVPHKKRAWVRIRDEGDKITLSYKQLNDRSLHGTKEVNLTVDSFAQAEAFLAALGLTPKTYQETKRESWRLGEIEVELDEWPWAKPFTEIEGPDEQSVRRTAGQLGLDWNKAVHGSVEIAYQAEYDVPDEAINTIPIIRFEDPVPEALAARRRA
jgi:adenylate cyclase class 2